MSQMAFSSREVKRGKSRAVGFMSLLALCVGVVALNPFDLALGVAGLWWVVR